MSDATDPMAESTDPNDWLHANEIKARMELDWRKSVEARLAALERSDGEEWREDGVYVPYVHADPDVTGEQDTPHGKFRYTATGAGNKRWAEAERELREAYEELDRGAKHSVKLREELEAAIRERNEARRERDKAIGEPEAYVRGILAERKEAIRELAAAKTERDKANGELSSIRWELAAAKSERDAACADLDKVEAELAGQREEGESLPVAISNIIALKDALEADLREARNERDAAIRERDKAIGEPEAYVRGILAERKEAIRELGAAISERNTAREQRTSLVLERDAAWGANATLSEYQARIKGTLLGNRKSGEDDVMAISRILAERSRLERDLNQAREERDYLQREVDAISVELASERLEGETLPVAVSNLIAIKDALEGDLKVARRELQIARDANKGYDTMVTRLAKALAERDDWKRQCEDARRLLGQTT